MTTATAEPMTGDAALLATLAQGETLAAAAEAAGVSERTARRRMASPEFKAELREARAAAVAVALARAEGLTVKALDVLDGLLGAKADAVRLAAARTVLTILPDFGERQDLAERLAAVEAALAARKETRT